MKKKILLIVLATICIAASLCLLASCGLLGNLGDNGGTGGTGGGGGSGTGDDSQYEGKHWWLYLVDEDGKELTTFKYSLGRGASFLYDELLQHVPAHYMLQSLIFADGTELPIVHSTLMAYLDNHQPDTERQGAQVYTVVVRSKAITQSFDFYVEGELVYHYDLTYEQWQNFVMPEVPEKPDHVGYWDNDLKQHFVDTKIYAYYRETYTISTAADWVKLQQHPTANFRLMNDVNFLGTAIPSVAEFSGTLDGQGHEVFNFINQSTACANVYGLFAVNKGTIKDITFTGGVYTVTSTAPPKTSDRNRVGFLVGINNGTIENVIVDDTPVKITCTESTAKWQGELADVSTAPYAGVIAGLNEGVIENCTVTDSVVANLNTTMYVRRNIYVTATNKVWASYGLIAGGNMGKISHVTADGYLASTAERNEEVYDYGGYFNYVHYILRVGGVAGFNNEKGTVSDSLSNAQINADYVRSKTDVAGAIEVHNKFFGIVDIGGIIGCNSGQVERCITTDVAKLYSYADAETRMGGLVGTNDFGATLRASYSLAEMEVGNRNVPEGTNTPEATYVGGITGLNSGTFTCCYAIVSSVYGKQVEDDNGLLPFGNDQVYFGGLFGKADKNATITNSFAVITAEGLINNNVCGYYDELTIVLRSYVMVPDNADKYTQCDKVTACRSLAELMGNVQKLGYPAMGYNTVWLNAYPTLPNVGHLRGAL